jgi:hypothetical protein
MFFDVFFMLQDNVYGLEGVSAQRNSKEAVARCPPTGGRRVAREDKKLTRLFFFVRILPPKKTADHLSRKRKPFDPQELRMNRKRRPTTRTTVAWELGKTGVGEEL